MSERQTMDTSVKAQTVKPSGKSVPNGTPGKVQGYGVSNSPFSSEGVDSEDRTKPWPDLPPYWNSDNTKMPKGGA